MIKRNIVIEIEMEIIEKKREKTFTETLSNLIVRAKHKRRVHNFL